MAMERKISKPAVKITGTAKSTGGNVRNQPMKEMAPAKKAVKENLVQDITNRFRVTAREARDIVTAVGTVMDATRNRDITYNNGSRGKAVSAAAQNLGKQIKETGVAAATGKKGTTSATSRYTTAGEHPTRVGGSTKRR